MTEESGFKSRPGLGRIWRAFAYSMDGLGAAWRFESAFRQELVLALVLMPIACLLPVGLLHKAVLIGCVFLVLIVELVNSAVEATVDRISLDNHDFSKRAKDFGSAAVFLSLANCAVVWSIILWEALGS